MAYNKKTWLARLGQGLNKFILNGGSRVTLESSPDTVTQQGTPLSAENMNDLEDRIDSEFTNVNDALNAIIGKLTQPTSLCSYNSILSAGDIPFADNPLNYDMVIAFCQFGSSGITRPFIFFPKLHTDFNAEISYTNQDMADFYGTFKSTGATILGTTSGSFLKLNKVYGYKFS